MTSRPLLRFEHVELQTMWQRFAEHAARVGGRGRHDFAQRARPRLIDTPVAELLSSPRDDLRVQVAQRIAGERGICTTAAAVTVARRPLVARAFFAFDVGLTVA